MKKTILLCVFLLACSFPGCCKKSADTSSDGGGGVCGFPEGTKILADGVCCGSPFPCVGMASALSIADECEKAVPGSTAALCDATESTPNAVVPLLCREPDSIASVQCNGGTYRVACCK